MTTLAMGQGYFPISSHRGHILPHFSPQRNDIVRGGAYSGRAELSEVREKAQAVVYSV